MNAKDLAIAMYPHWLIGIFVIWATIKAGYSDLLRFDKKAILGWVRFLILLTVYRIGMFKLFPVHFSAASEPASIIPWPLTLTVFWEDALHILPLILLQKLIGTRKWTWPIHAIATAIMMVEFGSGHIYQGFPAACMLSLYIPIVTRMGKKNGLGTVMLCHTLYDLCTILTIKFFMGA